MIDYVLTRCNKRKSIALQVIDGRVLVKAPSQISVSYIDKLLTTKERWIEQKIKQQLVTARFANKLCSDGTVWINGFAHKIVVHKGATPSVDVIDGYVYCTIKTSANKTDNTLIKKQLENWFKQRASQFLPERTKQLSQITGLTPSSVIVKKYRARWGSCDNLGRISLNYFLMMLPTWVIDYVIIHELCHLKHLNHSAQFWSLVEHHCAGYDQAKAWIKQRQGYLVWPKS